MSNGKVDQKCGGFKSSTGAGGIWAGIFFDGDDNLRCQVEAVVAHSSAGNHRIICSLPSPVADRVFDQGLRLSGRRPVLMTAEDFRRWWGGRQTAERAVAEALQEGWQGLTVIVDADYTGLREQPAAMDTGGPVLGGRFSFFFFLKAAREMKPSSPPSAAVPERLDLRPVLYMDRNFWKVEVLGRPVDLSPAEFELLLELARIPGRVVRYGELPAGKRGGSGGGTLAALIYRLRKKIEPDPSNPTLVQTVRGVGYRFVPP